MNKPESLKEALERSIEMWEYMVQNNEMNKCGAIWELWGDTSIWAECWLCEWCHDRDEREIYCDRCVQWPNTAPATYFACLKGSSPFCIWQREATKENAQKVLDHLKSEYNRLFPEEHKVYFNIDPGSEDFYGVLYFRNMYLSGSGWEFDNPMYSFKDDKPNWNLLCADLFEDNIPLAFISSGDRHYVAGIWNDTFRWDNIFDDYAVDYWEMDIEGAYDIFEVNNPEECKELVKKFTKRYKEYHKGLRRKACNRSKTLKRAKTWSVYNY